MLEGIVLKSYPKHFDILIKEANLGKERIYCCSRRKKISHHRPGINPVVGDRVQIELVNDQEAVIEEILPRRVKLSRRAPGKIPQEQILVANLDLMIIVFSTKMPQLNLRLLDRFIVVAESCKVEILICLNKCDLEDASELLINYAKIGYRYLLTSAKTGQGVHELESYMANKLSVLIGPSGSGKSSILNFLLGYDYLPIGSISNKTNKGRHTTTLAELLRLKNGILVADTPGLRELGIWGVSNHDLAKHFVEFKPYLGNCRFNDCSHIKEPACSIKQAVEENFIHPERYDSYRRIYETLS